MINSIVINSDDYEIQMKKLELTGWQITVYRIEHSSKEIHEQRTLKSLETAYVYVKENYLQQFFNKGVLV